MRRVLGVVASATGGLETLRTGLVEPALARGWRVEDRRAAGVFAGSAGVVVAWR